jgi:hypothetical protein
LPATDARKPVRCVIATVPSLSVCAYEQCQTGSPLCNHDGTLTVCTCLRPMPDRQLAVWLRFVHRCPYLRKTARLHGNYWFCLHSLLPRCLYFDGHYHNVCLSFFISPLWAPPLAADALRAFSQKALAASSKEAKPNRGLDLGLLATSGGKRRRWRNGAFSLVPENAGREPALRMWQPGSKQCNMSVVFCCTCWLTTVLM